MSGRNRVLALALGVSSTLAPNAWSQPTGEAQEHQHEMAADGPMAQLQARQQKLDELVARMNAATESEKVEAIAAVVNELVAQRKAMAERMQEMHEGMMDSMHGGAAPKGTAPQGPPHDD